MISLAGGELRVSEGWTTEDRCQADDCGSANVDWEILPEGKRCRCNICGLRGKIIPPVSG